MIDLTPLDVRKKKGDFRRAMRGYDAAVVDDFLDLVAERLEELVRDNAALRTRADHLSEAIKTYRERERAMNEALVSAQQLREEVREQATREAEIALKEARVEQEQVRENARRELEEARAAMERLRARRAAFLRSFESFLQEQLAAVEAERERAAAAAGRKGAGREQVALPDWLNSISVDDEDAE
jgi:DivIVA domain-containing protein